MGAHADKAVSRPISPCRESGDAKGVSPPVLWRQARAPNRLDARPYRSRRLRLNTRQLRGPAEAMSASPAFVCGERLIATQATVTERDHISTSWISVRSGPRK